MAVERLTDNRKALAASAEGLAAKVARTWARLAEAELDELKSSAFWGVVRAASSYEPSKGTWAHWAKLHANGEVREYLSSRSRKRWRKRRRSGAPLRAPDPRRHQEAVDDDDGLDHMIRKLPPKHGALCDLVYRHGLTPSDAGRALGVTGEHGCRIHQEALAHLRKGLAAA